MSKELEALNYLYNDLRLMKCLGVVEEAKVKSAYECLKQALLKAQEQEKKLKALEIIKNKRVDVDYFLTIIEKYNELEKQMKVYNHLNSVYEMLTQEEFDLLKYVFEIL